MNPQPPQYRPPTMRDLMQTADKDRLRLEEGVKVQLSEGVPQAGGDTLPEPGEQYMVLQLQEIDEELVPVWGWVRAHV